MFGAVEYFLSSPHREMFDDLVQNKRRGRKRKDIVDLSIQEYRRSVTRGLQYVDSMNGKFATANGWEIPDTHDDNVQRVLDRELELVSCRDLVEFRETDYPDVDEYQGIAGGSPVSARLQFPPLSVYKCIAAALSQLLFSSRINRNENLLMHAFTHESHILLSKACELLVTESVSRAFLQSRDQSSTMRVSDRHLIQGMRGAWHSRKRNASGHSPFEFLLDSFDKGSDPVFLLDMLVRRHGRAGDSKPNIQPQLA